MEITDAKILRKNADKVAAVLRTIANAERLLILCNLISGEQSVGELLKKSTLSQSAFSQHLSVLRAQGLVTTRKEMQTVYYSLTHTETIHLLEALRKIYCQ